MSCKHIGTRGGNAGKGCRNKANHGDFCAKHKKKKCPALAQDEVFGQPEQPQKEPAAAKYKFSVFQWTLNSQSEDPQKNLADIKSEWYFEVGNAQHWLHVHGALKLKHNGNYRLSNEKIRGVVEKILGKKVHLNATGTGDADAAWHQYITKQQGAEEVEL
jgi:hypothetical protein